MVAALFSLAGCEGDDGNNGRDGAAGEAGLACWDLNENGIGDLPDEDLNGDGVVDVLDCNALANQPPGGGEGVDDAIAAAKVESCATCHSGAGELHQDIYDSYVDESDLALIFAEGDVTSTDNGDGTFTVTLEFEVTKDGRPLDDPGLGSLEQKRFYAVEYFPDTMEYLNSCSMGVYADVDPANGIYSVSDVDCGYAPETADAQVYGYITDTPLVEYHGGTGGELPESTHVALYDNGDNTAVGFGAASDDAPDAYQSAANVEGCQKCHGTPYLKHGFRAAVVDGVPDFAACKSCHYDDRNGGHEDWQWMVDSPFEWATTADVGPDQEEKYAYLANIMNDTHMSHALEFPYPMSASNCVTCHEGKLDTILADEFFVTETCKSCHVEDGIDASPELGDQEEGEYYQEQRAPSMVWIWEDRGVLPIHSSYDIDCQGCHVAGGVAGGALFTDLHTGYDQAIYNEDGERYNELYTVEIQNIELDGNELTVRFKANDDQIVPEILVSLYGWDSKDFYIASHTYDGSESCPGGRNPACRMEYTPESSGGDPNALFSEAGSSGPGDWKVTLDFAAFVPTVTDDIPTLIADGIIRKAEITITPELELDDELEASLDAATQTFDLGSNSNVDDYFKGDNAIVSTEKCEVCHDQLAVTFHDGSGRSPGGDITVCRNCHNPTFDGSHLEMNSRSTENYIHAIHSFQAFDTDDTFEEFDPVLATRYNQHINHVFPNFTIRNCEACHVDSPVTYNVPDQSKSMPGVLSASYDVATWYKVGNDGLVKEAASRNISGNIGPYATGPASRACGACHRGRLINQDENGALQSFNAHTEAFGTYVNASEEDDPEEPDDEIVYGIIDKIMTMFD